MTEPSIVDSRPTASARTHHRQIAFHSLRPRRKIGIRLGGLSIPTDGTGHSTLSRMARIRLFAAARDAAGTARDELPGDTVGEVLAIARERYGARFDAVLATCRIWVNGEPAGPHDTISATDELAVLPPVSGG